MLEGHGLEPRGTTNSSLENRWAKATQVRILSSPLLFIAHANQGCHAMPTKITFVDSDRHVLDQLYWEVLVRCHLRPILCAYVLSMESQ